MPSFFSVEAVSSLLGVALLAASPPTPTRPVKLGLCVACHGEDGVAITPDAPHLAAQRESYLIASLTAYRRGERRHAAMQAVAGTLSARDIAESARWYATRRAVQAQAQVAKVAP